MYFYGDLLGATA